MYSIHKNSIPGGEGWINDLTVEQARGILIYLSHNHSVAKKVKKLAKDIAPHRTLRAVCVQCDRAFDPNITYPSCIYHSGELETDYDAYIWADHDERCHGTINTDEMREEHPEGFRWTCCDKSGDAQGCRYGHHQSDPSKVKEGLPLDGDDDDDDDGLDEFDDDDWGEEDEEDEEEEEEEKEKKKLVMKSRGIRELTEMRAKSQRPIKGRSARLIVFFISLLYC